MHLLIDDTYYLTNDDIFIAKKGKNIDYNDLVLKAKNKNPYKIISNKKNKDLNIEYVNNIKRFEKEYIKNLKVKPTIIGVTGTNGKTSTSTIIYNLLKNDNKDIMLIGSNGVYYNNIYYKTRNTTPSKLSIYYLINKYLSNNSYLIIELSSQGYNRISTFNFDYLIFTNLTEEHLDYHKTMNRYFRAKLKILNLVKDKRNLFINEDDKYGQKIIKKYKTCQKFSLKNLNIKSLNPISLIYENKEYKSNLCGRFNVYNILASIKLLKKLKIDNINNLLNTNIIIEGRNNIFEYNNNKIIIDYAHTPFSFENIISHYFKLCNKLYILFGFGGNKDQKKRSKMLDIAYKYSNNIILCEDNSRDEPFYKIIFSAIKKDYENLIIIKERKEAIKYALSKLNNNDCLLILGKGNEDYILKNKIKVQYSDIKEVEKWIQ